MPLPVPYLKAIWKARTYFHRSVFRKEMEDLAPTINSILNRAEPFLQHRKISSQSDARGLVFPVRRICGGFPWTERPHSALLRGRFAGEESLG